MKKGLLQGIKEYVYLKHADALLKQGSSSSAPLPESLLDTESKSELIELKGKTVKELDEWVINKLITPKYKKTIGTLFEKQLKLNSDYFEKVISSYFAHLLLMRNIGGESSKPITPENLGEFGSLSEMFTITTLVDTTKGTTESFDKSKSADALTLEGVLRWFVDTYVHTQFEYMLLDVSGEKDALICGIVPEEYKTDPKTLQQALNLLKDKMGAVYFIRLRSVLFNSLRDKDALALFKRGEFDARSMVSSHSKHIEDMTKANVDFIDSEKELNRLWLLVVEGYRDKYRKPLGRGRISLDTYKSEIKPILITLMKKGEKADSLSQLFLLDSKFDKGAVIAIKNFGREVKNG